MLRETHWKYKMRYSARSFYQSLLIAPLLVLIAASRILRLMSPGIIDDEVWTVWQTFGTPLQIIRWTPYDWPPLFYLLMGFWRSLVGLHPVADRYLSMLLFLLGSVGLYRVVRRLIDPTAAFLAMIAFAAFGYSIHISSIQRGYIGMLALMPYALWFAVRYFERPSRGRGAVLALSLTALFYIHYTSIFGIIALGLFTVAMYPRQVWRWWLPGLITAAGVAPLLIVKLSLAGSYADATQRLVQALPPLPAALGGLFVDLTGWASWLWFVLLASATALLLYRWWRWLCGSAGGYLCCATSSYQPVAP